MSGRLATWLVVVSLAAAASPDNWGNIVGHTITKDVVILGGGASGAHAAVRLREDLGKSIVVVEKQSRLGGHVATYIDPVTGSPYDFGVNSFTDYPGARDFFGRFNVSLQTPTRANLTTTFIDFTTGTAQTRYVGPAGANTTAALRKYLELCERYESMIEPSYATFPTAVPEDLALKFRDFAVKYGIEAAVPRIFQLDRPSGIICANLEKAEIDVFSKWDWSTVYVGVVTHPSLPINYSLTNAPAASVPSGWLELVQTPYVARFDYMGGANFRVLATGIRNLDSRGAQSLVNNTFNKLVEAGTIPLNNRTALSFKAWADHGPMHLRVSGSKLAAGFIQKQCALQGQNSTFYTGGAWSAQFTTILWEYNNQYLLPK